MAINTYVGLQGSGKSYEVVSGPILDAIAQGRRVVTNVAGVNQERMHNYLVEKRGLDLSKLGNIVHVSNDRVLEAQFFPDEERPDLESVVLGGDLVAIDEAWRCWGTDKKLSHEHMQFFRMHRHYVHPVTQVTCDVVLMTQDITGLHRLVRNVVEFTFRMHKHKSLGLASRYRVEIYEGAKLTVKTRTDQHQKKYDPKIFPLYQSYTGGSGQEKAIDARQNIFNSSALWLLIVGVALFMSVSAFFVWRFFHPANLEDASKQVADTAKKAAPNQSANTSARVQFSDSWRVVGELSADGDRWLVVANEAGRLRVESPSVFHGHGNAVIGDIDGQKVTRWSGQVSLKVGDSSAHVGVK